MNPIPSPTEPTFEQEKDANIGVLFVNDARMRRTIEAIDTFSAQAGVEEVADYVAFALNDIVRVDRPDIELEVEYDDYFRLPHSGIKFPTLKVTDSVSTWHYKLVRGVDKTWWFRYFDPVQHMAMTSPMTLSSMFRHFATELLGEMRPPAMPAASDLDDVLKVAYTIAATNHGAQPSGLTDSIRARSDSMRYLSDRCDAVTAVLMGVCRGMKVQPVTITPTFLDNDDDDEILIEINVKGIKRSYTMWIDDGETLFSPVVDRDSSEMRERQMVRDFAGFVQSVMLGNLVGA